MICSAIVPKESRWFITIPVCEFVSIWSKSPIPLLTIIGLPDAKNSPIFVGTAAATVLADQCIVAGSLATIALLKNSEAGQFLEQMQLPFLLIDQNRVIFDRLDL